MTNITTKTNHYDFVSHCEEYLDVVDKKIERMQTRSNLLSVLLVSLVVCYVLK